MGKTGLCSITFRDLSVEEIIDLCVKNNIEAIEWGTDVHLVPNNIDEAKRIKKLMDDNKLITSSIGSYYRVGIENDYSFESILELAKILDATNIRVWAGRLGSELADEDYVRKVIGDSKRIAELAFKDGIGVSYEYHGKTLTDTPESALSLLKAVNHPNMRLYWQPAVDLSVEQRIKDINKVKDYITNVHVFSWIGIEREPLVNQKENWINYIKEINKDGSDRYYILEFVKDDSIEQFEADVKVLNQII